MSWAGPYQYNIGKTRSTANRQQQKTVTRRPPLAADAPTLLCLSHLRWRFVYQRPQHLMSRFARTHRVLFFEEPIPTDEAAPWLEVNEEEDGVTVLVPRLPEPCQGEAAERIQRALLDGYLDKVPSDRLVVWYYTPMSLNVADHLEARLTVYDCMDELSAFRGAPPELVERERRLMEKADIIFTGGISLFEAKRTLHGNVHPFPSSVDIDHFAQAREPLPEPEDQADIPYPRLGFYGVIDERLDIELLDGMTRQRPDWHFVLVGPVVKIDPASLPRRANIHYLGGKTYDELPYYLAGWDVALMPFALNESTRFISPTKTPEYLAGGRPVVSTPITDVARTYGHTDIVRIAATADEFITAIEAALDDLQQRERVLASADQILKDVSWDNTWRLMEEKMKCAM